MANWKALAEAKRDAILSSIPTKWRVEKLPTNEEQKDVTGYIQQFLSKREIEITESDVVGIAKETSSGAWTATEVTEAFCHRASLAHQLVSCMGTLQSTKTTDFTRQIACMKPSSKLHSPTLTPWTSTFPRTRNLSAHYTVYPSA